MVNNGFWFDGTHCGDLGLVVEHYPVQPTPTRSRSVTSLLGRNGDLRIPYDSYSNINVAYDCYFRGDVPTPEQAHRIREWLMAKDSYLRLEDVYDPDYYRLAAFDGPLDIINILNKYGRCKIRFDCKPQCWLKSGQQPIVLDSVRATLLNPTVFAAKPLITVHGTGPGNLAVGKYSVRFLDVPESIILDCENQNAYTLDADGTAINKNNVISAVPFPMLVSGENLILFDGEITGVEIIPRWWRL